MTDTDTLPPADRQLIETITYLASLASESQAVDGMLDNLRVATANTPTGSPLAPKDRQALERTRQELIDYLVQREPMRTFTPEVVQQKLTAHLEGKQLADPDEQLQKSRWNVLAIALTALSLPLALLWTVPVATRVQLAVPLFLLALHLGIIWFYLSTLRAFTPNFHRVYAYICVGIFMLGVSAAQYPLINVFSLEQLPLFRYGGLQFLFVLACLPLYLGVRLFAKYIGVSSFVGSPAVTLGLVALAMAATVLVPHTSHVPHEVIFDVMLASMAACTVLLLVSARLVFLILYNVTLNYAVALTWFLWALVALALGMGAYGAVTYVSGETYGLVANLAFIPFMLAEIVLLQSGYAFKKISRK